MRSFAVALTWLIVTLAVLPSAVGSDPEISAKAEVDQAFITIGDRVHFRVTVVHDPKITILNMDADRALRDFEIKEVTDFSDHMGDQIHEGKNYVITSYELGEYIIGPVTISWQTQEGHREEFQTASLYLTVQSVDQDTDQQNDIRGVKGVHALKNLFWPWFLLFGIFLALGSLLAWYLVRKRTIMAQHNKVTMLNPHEEAYQALYRLKHSDYLQKGQYKLYFLEMSEILRRYFQRRYQISALESTTFEVMNDLKGKVALEQRTMIQEVLQLCDFVKFAKYTPSVQEVLKQNKQAFLIVDQTKEIGAETSEPIHASVSSEASKPGVSA